MKPKHLLTYPFGWLDQVIEVTLNPAYSELLSLNGEELDALHQTLRTEFRGIWKELKHQSFCTLAEKQHRAVIAHYHEYLKQLYSQALQHLAAYPDGHRLQASCSTVLAAMDELLAQIRKWYGGQLQGPGEAANNEQEASPLGFKVLCRLSVDQIAIILKAADDTRLLSARSFSLVLRTIVPFLSTERLADFSWKSARSSTYKMEDNDKEVAIKALEAMIRQISGYS
jgi:hypothetical protein